MQPRSAVFSLQVSSSAGHWQLQRKALAAAAQRWSAVVSSEVSSALLQRSSAVLQHHRPTPSLSSLYPVASSPVLPVAIVVAIAIIVNFVTRIAVPIDVIVVSRRHHHCRRPLP